MSKCTDDCESCSCDFVNGLEIPDHSIDDLNAGWLLVKESMLEVYNGFGLDKELIDRKVAVAKNQYFGIPNSEEDLRLASIVDFRKLEFKSQAPEVEGPANGTVIELSEEDWWRLNDVLNNPPEPTQALIDLMKSKGIMKK